MPRMEKGVKPSRFQAGRNDSLTRLRTSRLTFRPQEEGNDGYRVRTRPVKPNEVKEQTMSQAVRLSPMNGWCVLCMCPRAKSSQVAHGAEPRKK